MAFEYEALVGHLHVVSGRAVSMPPPGALCEVAPTRAARGRETDTFFALVTPSGDMTATASFYKRLAALAAERYFASTGSVTAGLRDLFQHVNQHLYDYNQKHDEKQYEANLICGVLRGADLIVGRVGACVAIYRHGGTTQSMPHDLDDDDQLYIAPLGVQATPDIKLTQFRAAHGSRLAFGDANLADLSLGKIDNALISVDVATALVAFKELAKLQMSLMVIEFVPPEEPVPEAVPVAESTAQISPASKRETAPESTTSDPLRKAEKAIEKETTPSTFEVLYKHGRRMTGRIALQLSKGLGVFGRMIEHYFGPKTESERRWLASPIGVGTVLILPFFVVGVVMVLSFSGIDETEFEICLQELNSRAETARSPAIVNSDRQRILNAWELVLVKADDCDALRLNDPQVNAIRAEGREITDRMQQITRLEPILIQAIPQAQLTEIVVQGTQIFVLDSANSIVYQISLNDDGVSVARPFYAIRDMRRGANLPYEVTQIFDIAYNQSSNRLMALSENGVLIECEIRFLEDCNATVLLGVERWGDPTAMFAWEGNGALYILDATAQNGQVWRYERSGGIYASEQGEYFSGATKPTLRQPVDLQIDSDGNIYVLLADGTITKHRGGNQETFQYQSFPDEQSIDSAQGFFVNDDVTAKSIYIASQMTRTVYETSLIGNFNNSYRTFDEDLFTLVADVAVVTDQNREEIIYVISGNSVFALVKPE
jgi:hypothetical protein